MLTATGVGAGGLGKGSHRIATFQLFNAESQKSYMPPEKRRRLSAEIPANLAVESAGDVLQGVTEVKVVCYG